MKNLERAAFVVLIGLAIFFTYKMTAPSIPATQAARDSMKAADVVAAASALAENRQRARADSAEQRSTALAQRSTQSSKAVTITSPTSVTVTRPETTIVVEVPPEVTRNIVDLRATVASQQFTIAAKDAALDSAAVTHHDDSVRVAKRDRLIAVQDSVIRAIARAPRWGLGGTIGYGAGGKGTGWQATVGVTFDVPLPRLGLPNWHRTTR